MYLLSRNLTFATIPKACGFEAATRFPSILLGGSLIPIVTIGMGMALTLLNTCLINQKDDEPDYLRNEAHEPVRDGIRAEPEDSA